MGDRVMKTTYPLAPSDGPRPDLILPAFVECIVAAHYFPEPYTETLPDEGFVND